MHNENCNIINETLSNINYNELKVHDAIHLAYILNSAIDGIAKAYPAYEDLIKTINGA